MEDFDNFAPLNQQLSYKNPEWAIRDELDLPNDPYNVNEDYYTKLAMRQWKVCPSKVAKVFFSVTNIKRIQKGIKREVYNRSYGKFRLQEDQNILDLLQAMLVIHIWYNKNLPSSTVRQVKVLNTQTVQYIVPDMMTNLKQYYSYLSDIKNPLNMIPLPLNINHAGRTQLEGTAQFYEI